MNRPTLAHGVIAMVGLLIWLLLVASPLVITAASTAGDWTVAGQAYSSHTLHGLMIRSIGLAAAVALGAVVLGYLPGRLFASAARGRMLLFWLMLAPLLWPRYVTYYVWSLLLSPTTPIGRIMAGQPIEVNQWIGAAVASVVQVLWYWPLAALVIAQGWRNIDDELLGAARMDAGPWQRMSHITLPLLGRSLAMAFAVCFVLVLCEYGTFHLAGVRTYGTELAVIYEATGSSEAVARASLPLVGIALVLVIALGRGIRLLAASQETPLAPATASCGHWVMVVVLLGLSLLAPLGLLLMSVRDFAPFMQFWSLQRDGLANALSAAALAAVLALAMAGAAVILEHSGRWAWTVSRLMQVTLLVAMFVPGSLVGVVLLRAAPHTPGMSGLLDRWPAVALGQAVRFAGLALLVLMTARQAIDRRCQEMARVDGAGTLALWRYIHWPLLWPTLLAALVLVAVFSLTELSATMLLLPPGVPHFTQRLLNQMHYARDEHVIASCLLLTTVFLGIGGLTAALVAVKGRRAAMVALAAAVGACCLGGCDSAPSPWGSPEFCGSLGSSGSGDGEFLYPRAIDLDGDGNLFVVDRTGRIQHLARDGTALTVFRMPDIEAGYPTGLSVGPDGLLYVADTHYHRVMIFQADGQLMRQFGEFGEGDGQFIYPTDVAFAPDGRVFVSEYGGNDRVSIYSAEGQFLGSFGRLGSGREEFSRPSALCVDAERGLLYVADACNHRIVSYTLDGKLVAIIGSVGQDLGQFRYPYDLALMDDGSLLICEYGNNRIQRIAPDGKSLGCYGTAGRQMGQLAYPWGLAVDRKSRVYVVDAGNNRVQVWQL
ncbi:MAG: SMP-30/gluconolactonase/LRE family protein [Planctomycetes bacterium]|nr:SMP-30/gluconolactonase/LRE family protein [Planctomycetota bacterium]